MIHRYVTIVVFCYCYNLGLGTSLYWSVNFEFYMILSNFYRHPGNDSKMLVCDMCDKGYHTFCLKPVMTTIPKNGWKCKVMKTRDYHFVT